MNPEAKAKPAAKKAIDEALKAKEAEIDARTDLTDEEKTAAKAEAKAAADKAKENVDKATTDAAVKEAETAGVSEVKAINPEAKAKPAAKKAIDEKLAEQLKAIENTPDATDEEKAEAIQKANDAAEQAKQAIDDAKTDAEVNTAKETGVSEIEKALPVVEDKPNARKAIDEEAKAKKAEIDARTDFSPKAKEVLKAKVDKVAEKAKEAIDSVSSVVDVNVIEEADKEAIRSIGDINRPVDKVLVKDPTQLSDEEKAKLLEEVKKVNPTAKEVKYNKDGNIEVTTENGDKGIIIPTKLVKTEDQLDNGKGGNDINKPLDKVIVKDPSNLTDEEKAKIVAKVEEVNPDAIVTIDENGTVSVSTPEGRTSAIPVSELVRTKEDTEKAGAGNSNIVKPADKIVGEGNDPDDQAKAEEKLRELNPETKSVKFDENGNATVTLKDGTTATIPVEDLFRSETDATKPNAGNDVVKPADKTVVANKDALTPEEKKAIEDKVKAVNPGATVVVDDKGNATVTTPEGKTAVIPASKLVIPTEKLADLSEQSGVNIPAARTLVADKNNLTPEEIAKIKVAVEAVNPGAIVVVDAKGNATVTTLSGKTATISAEQLIKDATDVAAKNNGENINLNFDKQVVADLDNLTDADKEGAKAKILTANPDVAEVIFDEEGNATVVLKDGKVFTILAKDIFMKLTPAPKASFEGNNKPNLVDKSKLSVLKGRLEEWTKRTQSLALEDLDTANKALEQAKSVLVDPNASQADVQDAIRVIEEILNSSQNKSNVQSDQTRTETPVATQDAQTPAAAPAQAANANQEATNARTVAKELPNTGTADSVAFMVAAAASAVLGLGLAGRRRKEDEEA